MHAEQNRKLKSYYNKYMLMNCTLAMHWTSIRACVCVPARNILMRLEMHVVSKEIRGVRERRSEGNILPGNAGRRSVGPAGNLWAVSAGIQGP